MELQLQTINHHTVNKVPQQPAKFQWSIVDGIPDAVTFAGKMKPENARLLEIVSKYPAGTIHRFAYSTKQAAALKAYFLRQAAKAGRIQVEGVYLRNGNEVYVKC